MRVRATKCGFLPQNAASGHQIRSPATKREFGPPNVGSGHQTWPRATKRKFGPPNAGSGHQTWPRATKRGLGPPNQVSDRELCECAVRPHNVAMGVYVQLSGHIPTPKPFAKFTKSKGLEIQALYNPHPGRAFSAYPPPKSERVCRQGPSRKGPGRYRPPVSSSSMHLTKFPLCRDVAHFTP